MFSLFGILVLIFFLYLRPQEVIAQLRALPMLNLGAALGAVGLLIDLRLARARVVAVPALRFLVPLILWAILCTWYKASGDEASSAGMRLLIPTAVLLLLSLGVTSFRSYQTVAVWIFLMGGAITAICLHQSQQPFTCFAVKDASADRELAAGRPDGRPCETPKDCYTDEAEPGAEYMCERPGLLNTSSIGHGRVRFRGLLQDPNEVAMTISIIVPFALALWERRRSALRGLLLGLTVSAVGLTCIYTQSRGGQMVFLAVLGAYFIRRFGWTLGAGVGVVLAVPVLLLGGRSGAEADASAMERIETLYVGVEMVRESPLFGVGVSQFANHHFLTAHNSYLLATAEMGFIGSFIWGSLIYCTVKTPVVILRRYARRPEAQVAVTWAMALLASWCGLLVGILFLSFSYHVVLFIHIGLSGALYSACRRHDPQLRVGYSLREALLIVIGNVLLILAIALYARLKLG